MVYDIFEGQTSDDIKILLESKTMTSYWLYQNM